MLNRNCAAEFYVQQYEYIHVGSYEMNEKLSGTVAHRQSDQGVQL